MQESQSSSSHLSVISSVLVQVKKTKLVLRLLSFFFAILRKIINQLSGMMFVKTCEIKTYCKKLLEDSFLRAVGSTSCRY